MTYNVGDLVRLAIREHYTYGAGMAVPGETGLIVSSVIISGEESLKKVMRYVVDFPSHEGWWADASDLEIVRAQRRW